MRIVPRLLMTRLILDYNHELGTKVGNYICRLKHKQLEPGDKADRLLARLRGMQADRAIRKIDSSSGQLLTGPKPINQRFFEFYKQLYSSQFNPSDADLKVFLIPCISLFSLIQLLWSWMVIFLLMKFKLPFNLFLMVRPVDLTVWVLSSTELILMLLHLL